jgi:subtilisin family serine protease
MAGPHVAGLVALLISAKPELKGQVEVLEASITGTAKPIQVSQTCGGIPGDTIPNNSAGWGESTPWLLIWV